jgi:hypothetical protein
MTRRKLFVFGLAAMSLSLLAAGIVVMGVDLYLHHRAERSAGLNRWGYRGPVVPAKAPGELRVVMLGGSTVFGYGGPWHESAPALLEQMLAAKHPGRAIRVINLGFNNEGAFAFLPTLQDYRYLDYDIVCLYEGYNDLMGDAGPNRAVFRHNSPVFRLTGYFPILPLVLQEKALVLRNGGNLEAGYRPENNKTVFRPGVGARMSATALDAANAVGDALGKQVGRLAATRPPDSPPATTCAAPWTHYCASVIRAAEYARAVAAKVLVVGQPLGVDPAVRRTQVDQQSNLTAALRNRFNADTAVAYADLGHAVDLSDRNYSFDKMHLGLDGNRVIAQALVAPIEQLAGLAESRRSER